MGTRDRLLTPGEVAAMFRVDPKTVTRWAAAGRICRVKTPGGHGRYRESEIRELLEGAGVDAPNDLIPEPRTPARRSDPPGPLASVALARIPATRHHGN